MRKFFLPSQGGLKSFDNFSTAQCLIIEQKFEAGQDSCRRIEFGDVFDRADIDRRALIFVHESAWKPFDVEVYDEYLFVSLFRVFSC